LGSASAARLARVAQVQVDREPVDLVQRAQADLARSARGGLARVPVEWPQEPALSVDRVRVLRAPRLYRRQRRVRMPEVLARQVLAREHLVPALPVRVRGGLPPLAAREVPVHLRSRRSSSAATASSSLRPGKPTCAREPRSR
jgi:hypothetical protein